ncbi:hypothetical protein ACFQZR_28680 [Paenibacillus sp. GCM10027629]|uniref:LmrA/YxaF family transcription factor n=1 Tax=Paenibacillus sp. GCM10027629 TaxID=3273414 RepID=UPI0036337A78
MPRTFDTWKLVKIERLKEEGCEGERAESIAMGIISLLEGSFVLALTYRNTEPSMLANE